MATPGRGGTTTWDAEANLDLLACLVNAVGPTQVLVRDVKERMHAMGHTCTEKAIKHRFQKLRTTRGESDKSTPSKTATTPKPSRQNNKENVKLEGLGGGSASSSAATKGTPASTISKKRGIDLSACDSPDELSTPTKKREVDHEGKNVGGKARMKQEAAGDLGHVKRERDIP
jgi:hypothetical protein